MNSAVVASAPSAPRPGQVAAWALWDWGSAAFNAVMVTFVFGTYLASPAFGDGGRGTAWLSAANAVAGVVIALTAPVLGRQADGAGRRRLWLGVTTGIVIAATAACALVAPDPALLGLGVVLIALGTVAFEVAEVHVNGILVQISTPSTIGRVSGIGWGAGYLGGIVLLLPVYVGFVAGDAHWFGLPEADAWNIRAVALVAAAWFLVFAIPVLVAVPDPARGDRPAEARRESLVESYRALARSVARLRREEPNTLRFLIASAVFRDGVGAVFVYGAILGTTLYGIAAADVILFAIAANVVAAVGAFVGGRTRPVPLRGPGAVGVAGVPGAPEPARDGGGGVRPLRDDGTRGRLHRPGRREPRARDLAGQPRHHPGHRGGPGGRGGPLPARPRAGRRSGRSGALRR